MADAADIAGDVTERRMEEALARRYRELAARQASRVSAACEECGDEIPAARRAAAPWASTCVACQSIRERRARGYR